MDKKGIAQCHICQTWGWAENLQEVETKPARFTAYICKACQDKFNQTNEKEK